MSDPVADLISPRRRRGANVSAVEAEIDQLVYSFDGLTREEIAIIEESLQERTVAREVADDSAVEE